MRNTFETKDFFVICPNIEFFNFKPNFKKKYKKKINEINQTNNF